MYNKLMPLCLKELAQYKYGNPVENLSNLMNRSGFHEKFLARLNLE
jgi:hypothetical protein